MAAKNQNFEMDAGETKNLIVEVDELKRDANGNVVLDDNGEAQQVITDLTGAQNITWILRKDETDTTNLLTKSTGNGGISISNPTAGEFIVHLLPVDTQSYKYNYFHKAILTDAQGNVSTTTKGTIRINP